MFLFGSSWLLWIWVGFLFIVHCSLIRTAVSVSVVLHVVSLCVTSTVLWFIFVYSLIVSMCHVLMFIYSAFCLTDSTGIVLLLRMLPLHVYSSWWSFSLSLWCESCIICWCGNDLLFLPLCHGSTAHHLLNELLHLTLMEKKHNFWKYHGFYHSLFVFGLALHNAHHCYLN